MPTSPAPSLLIDSDVHNDFGEDRKSTRLNSSHTVIYTPFPTRRSSDLRRRLRPHALRGAAVDADQPRTVPLDRLGRAQRLRRRSEEHTSELQSHSDLHSFPYTTLFRSSTTSTSSCAERSRSRCRPAPHRPS